MNEADEIIKLIFMGILRTGDRLDAIEKRMVAAGIATEEDFAGSEEGYNELLAQINRVVPEQP